MKKIELPSSQIQEVLYELINRISIDRKSMMLSADIMNLTARISDLRNKGLAIHSQPFTTINKYGREIVSVKYSLKNKKKAIELYKILKSY